MGHLNDHNGGRERVEMRVYSSGPMPGWSAAWMVLRFCFPSQGNQ